MSRRPEAHRGPPEPGSTGSPAKGPGALPFGRDLTTFFGRERELRELTELVDSDAALITIVGPAGVGKTRLARRFLAEGHARGEVVFFCDLRAADGARAFCEEVARIIGMHMGRETAVQELEVAVGDALAAAPPCTMVLDNFEHLARGSAAVTLSSWVRIAPRVRFVLTSRCLLRLQEEQPYQLGPLPLPTEATDTSSDAIKLFLERAKAIEPDFRDVSNHLADIHAVVALVEGLPLAIELAAGLMRRATPAEALEQLRSSQLSLEAPYRNADPRHRTLRTAIASSWTALTTAEQRVAAQLSVFRGGFGRDAAQAVIGADDALPASAVTEALEALRDASIIRVTEDSDIPRRWDMYEAIHEYAAEQLLALDGEESTSRMLRDRHCAFFAEKGEQWVAELHTRAGFHARGALQRERANLGVAFEWSVDEEDDPIRVQRLALAYDAALRDQTPLRSIEILSEALESRNEANPAFQARLLTARAEAHRTLGNITEARSDLDRASRIPLEDESIRASIDLEVGRLEMVSGNAEVARQSLQRAVEAATRARLPALLGLTHTWLAWLYAEHLQDAAAFDHYETALSCLSRAGDHYQEAATRGARNVHSLHFGRPVSVRDFQTQLAVAHRFNDRLNAVRARLGMGIKAFSEGRTDEAVRRLEEASELARASGLGYAAACCTMWMGMAYEAAGEGVRSAERYDEAIAAARAVGSQQVESLCCLYLAGQLASNARSEEALELLRRGLSLARERGEIVSQRVGALQDARIELVTVKRLRASGETKRSEALLKRIRRRFEAACREAALGAADSATQSLHTEFVRRMTLKDLEAITAIRPTLRLWTDGSAFQVGDKAMVSVGRGPVIRRVLAALGTHRAQAPGVGLSVDELLLAAWSDQTPTADSGAARVKTVVRRLRQAGLGEILRTAEGSYFLDPDLPIDRVGARDR